MSQPTTTIYKVYDLINRKPVGTHIQAFDILKQLKAQGHKDVTSSGVNNALHKMHARGYLAKDSTQRGVFSITPRTVKYLDEYGFAQSYADGEQRKSPTKKRRRRTSKQIAYQKDIDIIETLLDAMAQAEPVLKRYKKVSKLIEQLEGL